MNKTKARGTTQRHQEFYNYLKSALQNQQSNFIKLEQQIIDQES